MLKGTIYNGIFWLQTKTKIEIHKESKAKNAMLKKNKSEFGVLLHIRITELAF
jgi:hypothetical protein